MNTLKHLLMVLAGGLLAFNSPAAEVPGRPLHVLYLGPVSGANGGGGGFSRSRTNYIYLPGQTLAPEAIYFDHRIDVSDLNDDYLKHFDAVVQVHAGHQAWGRSAADAQPVQTCRQWG